MTEPERTSVQGTKANRMGFVMGDCPFWLVKKITEEADKWYGGTYWPVVVNWFRKAEEFDNIVRGGLPPPQDEKEEMKNDEEKDKGIPLFGGHRGV